jgi:hypothetical protein
MAGAADKAFACGSVKLTGHTRASEDEELRLRKQAAELRQEQAWLSDCRGLGRDGRAIDLGCGGRSAGPSLGTGPPDCLVIGVENKTRIR